MTMTMAKSKPSPVPWRVYPGGHLGKLVVEQISVFALLLTPEQVLWAALNNRLLVYRHQQWYEVPAPHTDRGISAFAWYRERVWVGGERLLAHNQALFEGTMLPLINALTVDSIGYLWVGTSLNGLWRTPDGAQWEQIPLPSQRNTIAALWSDTEGSVWVAERGRKPASRPLYRWHNGEWSELPLPERAGGFRAISCLTGDAGGQLWVGTQGNGVWRWADRTWTHFSGTTLSDRKPGLPGGWISGLAIDGQQRVWAATHNGIGCYDGTTWRLVIIAPEPVTDDETLLLWVPHMHSPTCLHLDTQGRLLIGTTDGQVGWIDINQAAYLDPLSYRTVEYEPRLVSLAKAE